MGFNKKYIDKRFILENISRIDDVFSKSDSIICMDGWSSNFLGNYFPKEKEIKRRIEKKFEIDSGPDYSKSDEYQRLKSLSLCLSDLTTNPTWLDISLVTDRLNLKWDNQTESGRFDIMRDKCLKSIIEHFDKN